MLHYNKKEGSQERQQTQPLSLEENQKVVDLINEFMSCADARVHVSADEENLLYRFINYYQNLEHHKATTVGLWATDRPDLLDEEKGFHWQIEF
jgi:hypothetical protein